MDVRFLTPARLEFLEALSFYESRAPGLGADFLDELERSVESIASNPSLGASFEGGTRRVLLRRFPFGIIYEILSDHVLVVAVAHHRRRPGHWRDRQ